MANWVSDLARTLTGRKKKKKKPMAVLKEAFWPEARGIFHVGAHKGQEASAYAQLGCPVIWFEALPHIHETLVKRIADYPDQRAIRALVANRIGETFTFHLADNQNAASSVYPPSDLLEEAFPDLTFPETTTLVSTTLARLIEDEGIDMTRYDVLTIDTQGAELLVLKGAGVHLGSFRFVKVEAADYQAYDGGCTLADIEAFMTGMGFAEVERQAEFHTPGVGTYYDVTYERQAPA